MLKGHKEQKRQKVQCLLLLYAFCFMLFAFALLSPPHHSSSLIMMCHLSCFFLLKLTYKTT